MLDLDARYELGIVRPLESHFSSGGIMPLHINSDTTFSERANRKENQLETLKKNLKEESNYVKDCFNRYSFQAIAMSGAGFLIIARYFKGAEPIGFISIFIVILLLIVSRIGGYKYNTANRNDAYRLHLERTESLGNNPKSNSWKPRMRYIGWQEAMRAWRVIQSTFYGELYEYHSKWTAWCVYKGLDKKYRNREDIWFKPDSLVVKGSSYYVGSYLKNIQLILYFICLIAYLTLIITLTKIELSKTISAPTWEIISLDCCELIILTIMLLVLIWRFLRDTSRRKQLERELLCIHSSGILWQAVVLAHARAKEACMNIRSYKGYTKALSKQAKEMIKSPESVLDIYAWIEEPTPRIRDLIDKEDLRLRLRIREINKLPLVQFPDTFPFYKHNKWASLKPTFT